MGLVGGEPSNPCARLAGGGVLPATCASWDEPTRPLVGSPDAVGGCWGLLCAGWTAPACADVGPSGAVVPGAGVLLGAALFPLAVVVEVWSAGGTAVYGFGTWSPALVAGGAFAAGGGVAVDVDAAGVGGAEGGGATEAGEGAVDEGAGSLVLESAPFAGGKPPAGVDRIESRPFTTPSVPKLVPLVPNPAYELGKAVKLGV
jgi:hypothetical protein